jgi:hypothetical protein
MALWRSRVRTPSGPPSYHQSEWYRGTPFVSERRGFFVVDMNELTLSTTGSAESMPTAAGATAPLVLGLHGWSQRNGWHTWEPLMPPLADGRLSCRHRSICRAGGEARPGMNDPMERGEAHTVVLSCPGQPLVPSWAQSWARAGAVALALDIALDFPERVSKLI